MSGQAVPTANGATGSLLNTLGGQGAVDAFDGADRTRLVGTYDFGVAKVGLGYETKSHGAADQYAASVSMPLGKISPSLSAVTLGLDYTARDSQSGLKVPTGAAAAAATRAATYAVTGRRDGDKAWSSVGVGAQYNFSKSANVSVSYITYQDVGANDTYAPAGTVATPTNSPGVPAALLPVLTATNTVRGTTPSLLSDEYRIRLTKTF